MARLRGKLEDNPHRPRHLLTEPGIGYRYQPEAPESTPGLRKPGKIILNVTDRS